MRILVEIRSVELSLNKLTSMLIITPETEVAFLANVKKSANDIKVPSLLAFGLRNNL